MYIAAAKRVRNSIFFPLFSAFDDSLETMINCQIKCKFICGCCKWSLREIQEKKCTKEIREWKMISKMTWEAEGWMERVKLSKKMEFKWKWNKIEMQEVNVIYEWKIWYETNILHWINRFVNSRNDVCVCECELSSNISDCYCENGWMHFCVLMCSLTIL